MDLAELYGSLDVTKQAKWFTHEPSGIEFLIAPAGNLKTKKLAFETFSSKDFSETGLAERSIMDGLLLSAKITANAILLDWKNVIIEDKEVKYSAKEAISMLVTYDELRTFIESKAAELRDEIQASKEQIAKK